MIFSFLVFVVLLLFVLFGLHKGNGSWSHIPVWSASSFVHIIGEKSTASEQSNTIPSFLKKGLYIFFENCLPLLIVFVSGWTGSQWRSAFARRAGKALNFAWICYLNFTAISADFFGLHLQNCKFPRRRHTWGIIRRHFCDVQHNIATFTAVFRVRKFISSSFSSSLKLYISIVLCWNISGKRHHYWRH